MLPRHSDSSIFNWRVEVSLRRKVPGDTPPRLQCGRSVVGGEPSFHHRQYLGERSEDDGVEHFPAKPAVESFDIRIQVRLARLDELHPVARDQLGA
jgi:hypothetical protein